MKEATRKDSTTSTYVIMACTLGSRILGFVRTALIGAVFGASGKADVLNAVFSIPNNLRKLFAEGALSSAFIPELSRQIILDETGRKAQVLSRNILGLQFLILIPLLILCEFFPEKIIRIFVQFSDPELMSLAISLFRILILYILLISISAVLMAVANSNKHFFIPALTPLLYSISVIGSIMIFSKTLGIFSVAVGVMLGGIAQIVFQWPLFRKLGYSIKPLFQFRMPEFRHVLKQWFPVLVTSSVFTIIQQVAILLSTTDTMIDGSTSAISNAIVFWQLPFGLFSASITTVLFPKMSRLSAAEKWQDLNNTIVYGLRSLFSFLLPSAILLMLFGEEVIAAAFQRGEFTYENTQLTFKVLVAYTTGMISVGFYNFLQRVYYSIHDYKTPIMSAVIVAFIDVALSLIAMHYSLGVEFLAYANSIAFSIGCIILYAILKNKLSIQTTGVFWKTFVKVIISVLPVLGIFFLSRMFLGDNWWSSGSNLKTLGFTAAEGIISAFAVLLMYYLLKVETLTIMFNRRN